MTREAWSVRDIAVMIGGLDGLGLGLDRRRPVRTTFVNQMVDSDDGAA